LRHFQAEGKPLEVETDVDVPQERKRSEQAYHYIIRKKNIPVLLLCMQQGDAYSTSQQQQHRKATDQLLERHNKSGLMLLKFTTKNCSCKWQ